MDLITRIKISINAYIKNDSKASAIASVITGKDCSVKDVFELAPKQDLLPGLLPYLCNSKEFGLSIPQSQIVSNALSILTKGRTLFLICGPSASGKDTLASYVKQETYYKGLSFQYCNKYTTRNRRGFEGQNKTSRSFEPSGNYEYFNSVEDMERTGDCALEYSLYDSFYAFSKEHLNSDKNEDKHLACIYGKFEIISEIKRKVLFDHKRIPISILIMAEPNQLEGRITRRHSMGQEEQLKRIKEMSRQTRYYKENEDSLKASFDIIISNGDTSTVIEGSHSMQNFFEERIEWANSL